MGYWIDFWTFSKKINSTEIPDDDFIRINTYADLMDSSGIINPTFKVRTDSWDLFVPNVTELNYARVAELNRYYFITNWRYDRGLWICEMKVDVLASNKSYIGALNTYVLRSASNYDGALPDSMYPMKTVPTISMESATNPFATLFDAGYFVIGVINGDSGSYGAVSYYVFTSAEFRSFSNTLLGSFSVYRASEISDELGKMLFNPFQYIVSCTWLPVAPFIGSALSTIKVGWWNITASCHRIQSNVRASGVSSVNIPKHPDLSTFKKYLACEPYSQYYLEFPPFGAFSIQSSLISENSVLSLAWDVDCITGKGRCVITGGAGNTIDVVHGQIGVPIQIAQMSPDIASAVQQIVPKTGMNWADSLISMAGNIGSALLAHEFPMQTIGSTGSFMSGYYSITLTGIFYPVADSEVNEFGAPCCKTLEIDSLHGYVLCAHGDFMGTCTETEAIEINSYLTSGFFYE